MPASLRLRPVIGSLVLVLSPISGASGQTPRAIVTPRAPVSMPAPIAQPVKLTSPPYQVVIWQNGVRSVTGGAFGLVPGTGSALPAAPGLTSHDPQVLVLYLPAGGPTAQALSGISACVAPICQLEIDQLSPSGQVATAYLLKLAVRTQIAASPPVSVSGMLAPFAFAYQVITVKATAPKSTSTDDWES
jgi:hypothetical protein